jgi:hypothetical protein
MNPEQARDAHMAQDDNLQAILAQDAIDWPDGHPCRNCGHLHWEHIDNDLGCEGWR